jgi:hypothetical protein
LLEKLHDLSKTSEENAITIPTGLTLIYENCSIAGSSGKNV